MPLNALNRLRPSALITKVSLVWYCSQFAIQNIVLLMLDFGQYGSTNDSSILRSSGLYKALAENKFNVPATTEAEGFEDPLPYFLLGDEIFPP